MHASSAQALLPQARLEGAASFRWLGLAVYDAQLWVAPNFEADAFDRHAFALELRYLRAFRGADIARRSIAEMRRAGNFTPQQEAAWERALASVIPDVKPGDRVVGVHRPGRGASFFVNGAAAGDIDDPAFASLFFAIWLGPQSSEPALRAALLGLAR